MQSPALAATSASAEDRALFRAWRIECVLSRRLRDPIADGNAHADIRSRRPRLAAVGAVDRSTVPVVEELLTGGSR